MARRRPRHPRRALRWPVRIVLGLVALAIVATAIVIGFVHTSWGRDTLRDEIVAELAAEFPGSTIERIEGSPFGTLVLRGITLNAPDGKPLVTIDRLAVSAELSPLLRKRVHVESVTASGVAVYLREQPPEPAKPDEPSDAPSEPSAWTIELPVIAVTDAKVTLESADGTELIDQIAITAGVWMRPGEPLAVTAAARGRWRGERWAAQAALSQGDTLAIPFANVTLGGARVTALAVTVGEQLSVTGVVDAFVPAALARRLAALELPGDLVLRADARIGGAIALAAEMGDARVDGELVADLAALRVDGLVSVSAPDLAVLSRGALAGAGTLVATFEANPTHARGLVSGVTTIDGVPPASALIAFDTSLDRAELVALARSSATRELGGPLRASAIATAERRGDAWELTRGHLVAHARDLAALRGAFDADLTVRGPLLPEPSLALTGTVGGTHIARDDLRIAGLRARIAGDGLPARTVIDADIDLTSLQSGATHVPAASLGARVTAAGDTIVIDLGEHAVDGSDGRRWQGQGGRVVVTPERISVAGLRTGSGTSQIAADATFAPATEDLTAALTARGVALALADPTLRGTLDADVRVARTRGSWRGRGTVLARGAGVPEHPLVDGELAISIAGRRIELTGHAENPELGRARIDLAVTGPRDPTDVRAWRRLPRSALDHLTLAVTDIDAAAVGGTGRLDGELAITGTDARGELRARGVTTPAGALDATLALAPASSDGVRTELVARVAELPPVHVDATLDIPARPFDPAAWQALGRHALREGTVRATNVAIDRALLARFGVDADYRGRLDATLVADTGARNVTANVDVRGVTGAKLRAPVDVHVDGVLGPNGAHAEATARTAGLAMTLAGDAKLTLDGILAGGIGDPAIDATLTLPTTQARELLALFGETQVVGGQVGGTVTVEGTLGKPTLRALFSADKLAVRSSAGRQPPMLDRLDVDARWSDGHAEVEISGHETGDRLLKISAHGRPDDLRSVTASIEAANFDLEPIASLATGELRGARGTLHAALKVRGLDPDTGDVRGMLHIQNGRLPLSPELGTLRRATLDVQVVKQTIVAKLDGRMGAGGGGITGTVTAQLQGGMPMRAELAAKLNKVSPIGALQPQISADITGTFHNRGDRWMGTVAIDNGNIYVPPEGGNELLAIGAPSDMIFVDKVLLKQQRRRPSTKPWLITKLAIGKTDIQYEDKDVQARVVARGNLQVEVGDGVGVVGAITTDRGDVDILGRRYRLDHGLIDFDGTTDPRLDVRIVHNFRTMTLTVDVRGRASDPEPVLSSDPASYTQGQLLSFLAGAEPGNDDSTSQVNQALVSGSVSFLSSRVGRRIEQHLPVKLPKVNYEAGTATSSRAVRFGYQLSPRTYVQWRQRLEARPDENPGEGVLEYQLKPWALFEATAGQRAAGGDLLFRKRW